MVFVTHPNVQREVWGDLVIVSDKPVLRPAEAADQYGREGARGAGRYSEEEVGVRVAREAVGKAHGPKQVRRCLVVLEAYASQDEPTLQAMPAAEPVHVLLVLLDV